MKALPILAVSLCALLLCALTGCGNSEPAVHEHEYIAMQAVAPTCTSSGQTEGQKCLTCGRIFEQPEPIPATGHTYSGEWTIDREATEEQDGEKSMRCLGCGERTAVTPIPRLAPSTQGLAYELNDTGDGYVCVGIGTAKSTTELRIPSTYNGLPVTEVGEQAFANNRTIVSLSIPSSVKFIWKFAFSGCSALYSIDLPNTVEYIAEGAFSDTAYYSNYTRWENGTLYIGDHLISVQPSVAVGPFTVRYGTRTISGRAFSNCTELTFANIPETVVSIGNSAFFGCSSMKDILLPESLRIIGNGALAYCTSLTEFDLPADVERILSSPFPGCTALENITVDERNSVFYSINNCLIERNTGTLISGCLSSVIPDNGGIKHIGNGAFYECENLPLLVLPEGIESIGLMAFYKCLSLDNVEFPPSLISIDAQAFRDCKQLTKISFSDNLVSVGEGSFCYCNKLTDVSFSYGLTDIAANAFAYCTKLTNINLPDSLRTLGAGAFTGCGSINYEVFGNCLYLNNWLIDVADTQVRSVELKPTTVGLASSAFAECHELTAVKIPASVSYIGDSAFLNCWHLNDVSIPEGIETIGDRTFSRCTRLTTLRLPSTITSIASEALLDCSSLTSLYYAGTEQSWAHITKEIGWDRGASQMTVVFGQ